MRQVSNDVKELLKGFQNNAKGTNPLVSLLEEIVRTLNTSVDGIPPTTSSPYPPHDVLAQPNQENLVYLTTGNTYKLLIPVTKNPQDQGEYSMSISIASDSTSWGPSEAGKTQPEGMQITFGAERSPVAYEYVLGDDNRYTTSILDVRTISEGSAYYMIDFITSESMALSLTYTSTVVLDV